MFKGIFFIIILFGLVVDAQDVYKDYRNDWLLKAEQSKPRLMESTRQPRSLVELIKDEKAFQHWKVVPSKPVDSLYNNSFKKLSSVVIDFGEHLTGYFTFSLEDLGRINTKPVLPSLPHRPGLNTPTIHV
jgi:hypothetical protein